jgi:hypothetical protein
VIKLEGKQEEVTVAGVPIAEVGVMGALPMVVVVARRTIVLMAVFSEAAVVVVLVAVNSAAAAVRAAALKVAAAAVKRVHTAHAQRFRSYKPSDAYSTLLLQWRWRALDWQTPSQSPWSTLSE